MNAWKLSTKLIGGFAVVATITLIVGFVGWLGVSNSVEVSRKLNNSQGLAKQFLEREMDHLNWAMSVSRFQLNESATEIEVEKDPQKCGFGKWYYGESRKAAESEIPEIKDQLIKMEEPHRKLHQSAQELEKKLKKGPEFRKEAMAFYQTDTLENLKNVRKIFGEIRPIVDKHIADTTQSAASQAVFIKLITILGMILGSIIALVLGFFLARSVTGPINRAVAGLTDGANQVSTAAGQVASSSQSLAEGTSEQASSLEETSASLEEMSSMTRQNADNANQAKAMMGEASKVVQKVSLHMDDMSTAIAAITRSSEETGKIIKTIDEIAFQTNLLALNAAVEAARAGEAGAGFAVVADEVRNLAMRASDAAKNTNELIENTIKAVHKGNALTSATRAAFQENIAISGKIGALIDEISAATEEQSHGISQVNLAVSEMDKVTQSTAASSEESAAAAEELTAQAEQMKSFVADLARVVHGNTSGPSASSARNDRNSRDAKTKITKIHSARKALALPEKKTGRQHANTSRASQKAASPEQLIPFNDGDFKDF